MLVGPFRHSAQLDGFLTAAGGGVNHGMKGDLRVDALLPCLIRINRSGCGLKEKAPPRGARRSPFGSKAET